MSLRFVFFSLNVLIGGFTRQTGDCAAVTVLVHDEPFKILELIFKEPDAGLLFFAAGIVWFRIHKTVSKSSVTQKDASAQ